MPGSITLVNLTGYSLGVATAEVGINVQKVSIKASGERIEVKDNIGHITGFVAHANKQEYNIEGFVTGATGAIAAALGSIITVANVISLGGITAGACILDDITIDDETGTLQKLTYKATRYPDIPTSATSVQV
jgi:hypothetical protein